MDGTYVCECNQGFENEDDPDSACIDIDECNDFNCGFNSTCTNTIGSYLCECGHGYEHLNTWEQCQDIDECSTEVDPSEPAFCRAGTCSNYPGGYECTCPENTFLTIDNGPNSVPFCGKFFKLRNWKNKNQFSDFGILALNSYDGNSPVMIDSSGMCTNKQSLFIFI